MLKQLVKERTALTCLGVLPKMWAKHKEGEEYQKHRQKLPFKQLHPKSPVTSLCFPDF